MKEPRAEQYLRQEGFDFEYRPFAAYEDRDREGAFRLQARLGKRVIPELVQKYARMRRAGEEPPASLCFPGTKPFALITFDGIHRDEAGRAVDAKGGDVYVVKTDDEALRDFLIRATNGRLNGVGPSDEENLTQAAFWRRRYSRTIEETASRYGVTQSALLKFEAREGVKARLEANGVNGEGLPASLLVRMAALKSDPILVELFRLLTRIKASHTKATDLITALNAERSEEAQLERLVTFCKEEDVREAIKRSANGRPIPRSLIRERFIRTVRDLQDQLQRGDDLAALQLDRPEQRSEMHGAMRSVWERWNLLRRNSDDRAAAVGARRHHVPGVPQAAGGEEG